MVFLGTVWYDGPWQNVMTNDVCNDTVGNPSNDNTLQIKSIDFSGFFHIKGESTNPLYSGSRCLDFCPSELYPILWENNIPHGMMGLDQAATKLLSRSNPSRPGVTPLTLIQDLVEIPRMLRDVGKLIKAPHKHLSVKELANKNLAVQFGWLPLISDLKSVTELGSTIEKRKSELQHLYSGRGLRRRITLDRSHNQDSLSGYCGVGPFTTSYTNDRMGVAEMWGVAHWKPTEVPRIRPSDRDLLKKAIQLASGMTVEGLFDGAWDLIPWSFLVDYFTDVHGFVLAHGNTVPATFSHGTIMVHQKTYNGIGIDCPPGYDGGQGPVLYEQKERFLCPNATINAFLPHIGVNRLSILSSLFIQRFK